MGYQMNKKLSEKFTPAVEKISMNGLFFRKLMGILLEFSIFFFSKKFEITIFSNFLEYDTLPLIHPATSPHNK